MQDMGSLQPGLPSPTMLPQQWDLLIVDLKDCFFTIPLHPEDCERFAFPVPSINHTAPAKRYHWVVLPQKIRNSPTICQWYIDLALQEWKQQHPDIIVYHYMDDLLLCSPSLIPDHVLDSLIAALGHWGLMIAPEKVQHENPWTYLGLVITESRIWPQKLKIRKDVDTE